MSLALAATQHSNLSNGRSALKQEVKSLCLKVRNPAEKQYSVCPSRAIPGVAQIMLV
jgi:hypothetical protein